MASHSSSLDEATSARLVRVPTVAQPRIPVGAGYGARPRSLGLGGDGADHRSHANGGARGSRPPWRGAPFSGGDPCRRLRALAVPVPGVAACLVVRSSSPGAPRAAMRVVHPGTARGPPPAPPRALRRDALLGEPSGQQYRRVGGAP